MILFGMMRLYNNFLCYIHIIHILVKVDRIVDEI